jgi:hypothetical protein
MLQLTHKRVSGSNTGTHSFSVDPDYDAAYNLNAYGTRPGTYPD